MKGRSFPVSADQVVLTLSCEVPLRTPLPDDLEVWRGRVTFDCQSDEPVWLGDVVMALVDFYDLRMPLTTLGCRHDNLRHIVEVLLDGHGRVKREVTRQLRQPRSRFMLINEVYVEPVWRGYGLAPLMTGLALQRVGRGKASAAAIYFPGTWLGNRGDQSVVRAKVVAGWASLGFAAVGDHVYLLDLSSPSLDEGVDALRWGLM